LLAGSPKIVKEIACAGGKLVLLSLDIQVGG